MLLLLVRPLERCRRLWENDIETSLKKMKHENVDSSQLTHDMEQWRILVKTVTNVRFA
jgi:hypothetical protein